MSSAFVVWQDPGTTLWEPVAKLSEEGGFFKLAYTRGALNKRFSAFPRMDHMVKSYISTELFPFFQNRLIPERRPEYYSMLNWLDMVPGSSDPIDILSASGGSRKTDSFRIVKVPQKSPDGFYKLKFFVSGIRYVSDEAKIYITHLTKGERLECLVEPTNSADQNAIKLVRIKSCLHVGYYPSYLNEDLIRLNKACGSNLSSLVTDVRVVKVNLGAPEQYRLLCESVTPWPDGFVPFQTEKYELIAES
ncbi:HIRAN domain-containing protein [Pseudomonas putida]|uniref:HIRAN domain-containing protein n=1 Tax=Pseudomonas putida TaxID=303 RepID=UPI000A8EF41F|nr:HIRAN domain-containing protein [Pseudomonas putida]